MLATQQIAEKDLVEQLADMSCMPFVFQAGMVHVFAVTFPFLCCRVYLCGCKPNYLDIVLSVVCAAMTDQIAEWGRLGLCGGGPSMWLLGVYVLVLVSALLYYIQKHHLGIDSCLMLTSRIDMHIAQDGNKENNQVLMRTLARCWNAMLALLCILNVVGVMCLAEVLDSECWVRSRRTGDSHASLIFVLMVLTLSGLSMMISVIALLHAKVVSGSLNRGSAALKAIMDKDFVERWGEPRPVLEEDLKGGIDPQEIARLPCMKASCCNVQVRDCAICLSAICPDDRLRVLPACGHAFHRPCIDQWLLRSASCPLCKTKAAPEDSATSSSE